MGERFTCPECGEPVEVYSRIAGYYRPVQNWNDGKAEEYRERKLYDPLHSTLKHSAQSAKAEQSAQAKVAATENAAYLFTTKTCPNCRTAKSILDGAGINYCVVDAKENEELVHAYGVVQALTLIVVNGCTVLRYANASNIKKYAQECC